ncbi:hypothetical protein ACS0TY_035998 [Phlomoides rotata]
MSTSGSKRKGGASGGASTSDGSDGDPSSKLIRGDKHHDKSLIIRPTRSKESQKTPKKNKILRIDYSHGAPALFAEKAEAIRGGLFAAVPQLEVVLNGGENRAGCFVVREADGEVFVNLVGMETPFPQLTELNVDLLVARILSVIGNDQD